jgi:hypothetical protein
MSKKIEKSKDLAEDVIEVAEEQKPITMFGLYKDGPGWRFCEAKVLGDKVISKEETDFPTMKSICWEEFRIRSVKEFLKDV